MSLRRGGVVPGELLVIIAILALLATIASSWGKAQQKTRATVKQIPAYNQLPSGGTWRMDGHSITLLDSHGRPVGRFTQSKDRRTLEQYTDIDGLRVHVNYRSFNQSERK